MKTRFYGKDWSPILLQTFDCARIICKQNPSEFEFNEDFILSFYEVIINCKLIMNFNCESERRDVISGNDDAESSDEFSDWKNAVDVLIAQFSNKSANEEAEDNGNNGAIITSDANNGDSHHKSHSFDRHSKESFEILTFKYRLTMEVDPWHAASRYFLLWHSCGSPQKRKSGKQATELVSSFRLF